MAENQAAGPAQPGSPTTAVDPAKATTVLTGDVTPKGTAPLATGTPPELPHPWMNGLTTEQQNDAELIKILESFKKGIPDLAPAYAALSRKLGRAIVVPGEKATDEERAAYRKAIGVPDKPQDYTLERIEGLPQEIVAKMDKSLTEIAHATNLSQDQLSVMRKWAVLQAIETNLEQHKQTEVDAEETRKLLRLQFGSRYDLVIGQAEAALSAYAPNGLQIKLKQTGLLSDPDMIRMLIKLGQDTTEAPFVDGKGAAAPSGNRIGRRSEAEIAGVLHPEPKT